MSVGGSVASAVMAELPGNDAAELLYTGTAPTADGLRRLAESRGNSLKRASRPRASRDLGMAYLLLAERESDQAEAGRLALEAEQGMLACLARSPADTIAWSMVPFAALRRGDGVRAIELLETGIRVVPVAPDFALNRVAVLLRAEQPLDGDRSSLLDRELAIAVRRDPLATAALVRERGFVEQALARLEGDPVLARALEDALAASSEAPEPAE